MRSWWEFLQAPYSHIAVRCLERNVFIMGNDVKWKFISFVLRDVFYKLFATHRLSKRQMDGSFNSKYCFNYVNNIGWKCYMWHLIENDLLVQRALSWTLHFRLFVYMKFAENRNVECWRMCEKVDKKVPIKKSF